MKKLTAGIFATMLALVGTAAHAEIASTTYVGKAVDAKVGTLTTLKTDSQDTVVSAINEVVDTFGDFNDLDVQPDDDETVVGAINALNDQLSGTIGEFTDLDNDLQSGNDSVVDVINDVYTKAKDAKSTADTAKSTADEAKSTAESLKETVESLGELVTEGEINGGAIKDGTIDEEALDSTLKSKIDNKQEKSNSDYQVGNSSGGWTALTDTEKKALQSGITTEKVSSYDGYAATISSKLSKDNITAGDNVSISDDGGNVKISATDTKYTAGNGIDINSTTISVKAGKGLEDSEGSLTVKAASNGHIAVREDGVAVEFAGLGENSDFQASISGALKSEQSDLKGAVDQAVAGAINNGSNTQSALSDYAKKSDLSDFVEQDDLNSYALKSELPQVATADTAGTVKSGGDISVSSSDGTVTVPKLAEKLDSSTAESTYQKQVSAGNGISTTELTSHNAITVEAAENGGIEALSNGIKVKLDGDTIESGANGIKVADGKFIPVPSDATCSGDDGCALKFKGGNYTWEPIADNVQ